MENIIPIINFHGQDGIRGVRAKALYSILYADPKNYARWVESYITGNPAAIRGQDWVFVTVTETNPQGGRPSQEYDLSLEFAEHLALMANSSKGMDVRNYFRACRDELKAIKNSTLNDPSFLRKTLIEYCTMVEEANAKIAAQAPLVAYAEKVQGSVNSLTVDQTAKTLGLNVTAFRKFVQGKYLFRRGGEFWPYEEYGESGRRWFEVKTGSWTARSGSEIACHTVKVTGLGQIKLKDAWERAQTLTVTT